MNKKIRKTKCCTISFLTHCWGLFIIINSWAYRIYSKPNHDQNPLFINVIFHNIPQCNIRISVFFSLLRFHLEQMGPNMIRVIYVTNYLHYPCIPHHGKRNLYKVLREQTNVVVDLDLSF